MGISNVEAQTLEQTIPVSPSPMKLVLEDNKLFTSSFEYPHVSIIDLSSMESEFFTTSDTGVMGIEVISEMNKLYVSMYGSSKIDVFFLNMTYFHTLQLPSSQISFEAPPSDQISKDLSYDTGGWAISYNQNLELVYVLDYHSDIIYVINPYNDQIIEQITVPAHPFEMAIDEISNTLIVTSTAGNSVSVIEPVFDSERKFPSHKVVKTINVHEGPWDIEIDSEEHIAYIANRGSEEITVLSIIDARVIKTIPLEYTAQALTLDAKNNILYVSHQYENQINSINLDSEELEYAITTETYPWDIHYDEKTGRLFAALKDADKVAIYETQEPYNVKKPYYFAKSNANLLGLSEDFWITLWDKNRIIHTTDDDLAIVEFDIQTMCPTSVDVFCLEGTVTQVDNSNLFEEEDYLQIYIIEDEKKIMRTSFTGVEQVFNLELEKFIEIDST
ncbi:YncE family protein [Nitrosopumilus sp.]|uniref:YncE family protein n=1 Tax=Nitrosopumilus sp. TaxID=2024843 RepID=UPI00247CB8E5|nr:YncE family protein [Nitrosopumilus sp.]MCV0409260.1 YncE family protein [Nitrosopumilus sp.]